MNHFSIYEEATGRILQFMGGEWEADIAMVCHLYGRVYAPAPLDAAEDTHYVFEGNTIPRPTSPATLEGTTLSNVPFPSVLSVAGGGTFEVDEDTIHFDGLDIGTYKLTLTCFPYLDATFEITI